MTTKGRPNKTALSRLADEVRACRERVALFDQSTFSKFRFRGADAVWPVRRLRLEASWMLVGPAVTTAALALAMGLFANAPPSALEWVRFITEQEYR